MAHDKPIRYGDRDVPVIGRMKVGGKQYLILEKIGRGDSERFWAYEKYSGLGGEFRRILVLPRQKASRQHLAVLRRLSQGNPNLPIILECRPQGSQVVIVTTWVHGEDLASYYRTQIHTGKRPWPSPIEVMKLYRGLAHGLSQMHRHRGVVHGDIKPANLVLATKPERLVAVDFGTAWTVERTVRRDRGDGTTEHYAAPEQLAAEPTADSRSDQFSASLVAYWMLTGKRPYGGMGGLAGTPENRPEYEPQYQPPSRACPLRRQIPTRIWNLIDEILAQALALDPDRRFPSSHPWLDALEDLHCEMRRKVRFGLLDKVLFRWFDRLHNRTRRCP